MKIIKACLTTALITLSPIAGSSIAQAALYNKPLASNAYITFGGYQWAWASAVAADGRFGFINGTSSAIDLSYQSQFGWRLATIAELRLAPMAANFKFSGANVLKNPINKDPVSGSSFNASTSLNSDAACAAAYFTNYGICNWSHGQGNGSSSYAWSGLSSSSTAETLVLRGAPSAVPVPAALPLLLGALGGFGVLGRLRHRKAARA